MGGEKAMNRQVAAREAGDCFAPRFCCPWRAAAAMVFSHFLLPRGGAARAVVHGEAVNNGSGGESRRFRRIAQSAMRRACRAPPISPRCAEWGGICTCAENAAFGEVGEEAKAGKAAVRYRSAFAKGADGVYIKAVPLRAFATFGELLPRCCSRTFCYPVGARHAPLFTAKP